MEQFISKHEDKLWYFNPLYILSPSCHNVHFHQQNFQQCLWRPISWRARKTHVTRDVGAQAGVKTLTMILYARSLFIIKSALLETGHVSRSQIV